MNILLYTDTFIWLGLFLLFGIIELATFNLVTMWFSSASFVNIFVSLFKVFPQEGTLLKGHSIVPFYGQIILFFILSFLFIALFYPPLKRHINKKAIKTNFDAIENAIGKVTKTILPNQTGQIKVRGSVWTAISKENEEISEGTKVSVCSIEGVKAIVTPIHQSEN